MFLPSGLRVTQKILSLNPSIQVWRCLPGKYHPHTWHSLAWSWEPGREPWDSVEQSELALTGHEGEGHGCLSHCPELLLPAAPRGASQAREHRTAICSVAPFCFTSPPSMIASRTGPRLLGPSFTLAASLKDRFSFSCGKNILNT